MLESLTLSNFKSYEEATLELGTLTTLIGANASGKSNAIEALEILTWLARGRRLSDMAHAMKDGELRVRGMPSEFAWRGGKMAALGVRFSSDGATSRVDFKMSFRISSGGLRISEEYLWPTTSRVALYETQRVGSQYGHDVQVAYDNFARGGKKPLIVGNDEQAIFTQLLTPLGSTLDTRARRGSSPRRASKSAARSRRSSASTRRPVECADTAIRKRVIAPA